MTTRTIIAGGIVIQQTTGLICIVNQNGNSWSLPKGHVEPGESAEEAAIREITEETGITELKKIAELGSYERYRIGLQGGDDTSELKTIAMFCFTTEETDLKPMDAQNPEALWVERNDVAARLTHEKDREFFRSVLNRLP